MIRPIHIAEGFRFFGHRLEIARKGTRRYKGDAAKICWQIIDNCWNRKKYYFQTSAGHYCEFWTRDFGFCAEPLVNLGYRKKVINTLKYALRKFSKTGLKTTISPRGKPFDFPYYSVDSLPLLIRTLRVAKAKYLAQEYNKLLNCEIHKFCDIVIDKDTGLVRKNRRFSSMKDHSVRKSSCYDNVMAVMLKDELKRLMILDNPLKDLVSKNIIKENFWHGDYFLDDLSGSRHVAGDANVFPFWTGVFKSRNMLMQSMSAMRHTGLDKPIPLKYTSSAHKDSKMILAELFVPGWQRDSIWTQLGALYLGLVKRADKNKFRQYKKHFSGWIESNQNYLEVLSNTGKPYKSILYHSDESMLWASIYLDLIR